MSSAFWSLCIDACAVQCHTLQFTAQLHAMPAPTRQIYRKFPFMLYTRGLFTPTQSLSGILIYASMAAEKAAKPAQPRAAACGPALYAKAPPVRHPAATEFVKSLFARYPSIQHSVPLYMAPISMKFLAELYDRFPMSLKPALICSRVVRVDIAWPWGERGVS